MNQDTKLSVLKFARSKRIVSVTAWKKAALGAVGLALVLGLMGCELGDLLTPFDNADIPFEQQSPTTQRDMGAVDNAPTVPNVDSIMDNDPFPVYVP